MESFIFNFVAYFWQQKSIVSKVLNILEYVTKILRFCKKFHCVKGIKKMLSIQEKSVTFLPLISPESEILQAKTKFAKSWKKIKKFLLKLLLLFAKSNLDFQFCLSKLSEAEGRSEACESFFVPRSNYGLWTRSAFSIFRLQKLLKNLQEITQN